MRSRSCSSDACRAWASSCVNFVKTSGYAFRNHSRGTAIVNVPSAAKCKTAPRMVLPDLSLTTSTAGPEVETLFDPCRVFDADWAGVAVQIARKASTTRNRFAGNTSASPYLEARIDEVSD